MNHKETSDVCIGEDLYKRLRAAADAFDCTNLDLDLSLPTREGWELALLDGWGEDEWGQHVVGTVQTDAGDEWVAVLADVFLDGRTVIFLTGSEFDYLMPGVCDGRGFPVAHRVGTDEFDFPSTFTLTERDVVAIKALVAAWEEVKRPIVASDGVDFTFAQSDSVVIEGDKGIGN